MTRSSWVVLGSAVLFGSLRDATADDRPPGGGDAPEKALTFPGPDAEAVVAFLDRIRKGRDEAERATGDLFVRGRVSAVGVDWEEGMADQAAETLPDPDWRQFLLVHKGRKRRYDGEFLVDVPGAERLATVYRLMDGEAFYKLDLNTLDIVGPERDQETWEGLASDYFEYGRVYDGRHYAPLAVVCRTLIERVKEGKDASYWKDRVLRCVEEDGLLAVENATHRQSKYGYMFWVDPRRSHQVVRSRDERGGPGGNVHYHAECRTELAEAAPSVFLPKRATMFLSDLGSVARRDGEAGWLRRDMEVTRMKVGTIEYDDRLFDFNSLPVPKNAHITDRRGLFERR